jgi:hypothetical protein
MDWVSLKACWQPAVELMALTPALSQVWERELETALLAPVPLLPELGEGARG